MNRKTWISALWGIAILLLGIAVLLFNFGVFDAYALYGAYTVAAVLALGGLAFLIALVFNTERWVLTIPGFTLLSLGAVVFLSTLDTFPPEYMGALGLSTGRFAFDWFKTEGPLTEALQKKFGRDDLISGHSHPYLYLNLETISSAGLDLADVELFVADELMKIPGIAYALTRSDLLAGRITESPIQNQIRRSFHPTRSGNIHMVPEQYWFLHSTEEAEKMGIGSIAAIHGSPWAYDTYVPIFFAGSGVPAQIIGWRVAPTDIAPTLAAYLGVKPPSGSVGSVLTEVLP